MIQFIPPVLRSLQLPLRLKLWDGNQLDLGPRPQVTLVIKDPSLVMQLSNPSLDVLGGAYVEGRVELEGKMSDIIKVGVDLSEALVPDDNPAAVEHELHDKATDAAAISYHYDLSNEFYALWLDPEMVYSCGYFATGSESLEQAQLEKIRLLCRKLRLQPGDKLLDVGCGWGGFARLAAREFGAKVYGITLSAEQLKLARERVAEQGLDNQVELQLMDYRDLPQDGRFDKVVSVGMFEHVGYANLPEYCQCLYGAVKPGGLVMNHGITARHTDGRAVGHGAGNFIGKYVFPHGELPHLSVMTAALSDAGLEVVDVESLRLHYARTLNFWSERLETQLDRAALMVPEQALRIWRLYLAGCAYGFAQGWMNLHQILAVKPLLNGGHDLPWSRADIYS
ncbi:C17 cyclopropane fatty acid synthase CfaB [Pseudomonas sp. M30-35]|uniref:C17 cyclopropane fatty acid synthase CfaB n=1 Tax=Pseudomonas sp. M30-35 TaxID=1981174 RepID=UPI000B3C45AF|nr:C17 cyclopropane fatty acid synthase CfaB [Pseudomonas sp. M30-35]ARU90520.1 SAM-dependent methyltransferase [Pseudomonas sp. M30-35]